MNEKKLYALTDDVVRHIGQGLQGRASGLRANGDVERAAHVRSIVDDLTPLDRDDAVERMAGAAFKARYETESFTWAKAGLFRESYRKDARAALDALLGGGQE